MNKPSERIVVFVTPAQKRAIAATAERLEISVSELMRRAVMSFGATGEQVKAASIVDRLHHAPRPPDALDAALRRVARQQAQSHASRSADDERVPPAPAREDAAGNRLANAAPEPVEKIGSTDSAGNEDEDETGRSADTPDGRFA